MTRPSASWSTIAAIAASLIYLVVVFLLVMASKQTLAAMKMEEIGNFLSGVFAPLAFFWLVLGYYLQRRELELQREEITQNTAANVEQAEQLKAQAEHLAEQVLALKRQHEVLAEQLDVNKQMIAQSGLPAIVAQLRARSDSAAEIRLTNRGSDATGIELTCPGGSAQIGNQAENSKRDLSYGESLTVKIDPSQGQNALPDTIRVNVAYHAKDECLRNQTFFIHRDGRLEDSRPRVHRSGRN